MAQLIMVCELTDKTALFLCAPEHVSHGSERTTQSASVPPLYL